MNTYILLLRGINVSGQKKILMADLKQNLSELGYANIKTYIQSGNLVFQSEKSGIKSLQDEIEQKIFDTHGFEVKAFIILPEDLQEIIQNNPFIDDMEKDVKRTYFTFLSKEPDSIESIDASKYPDEEFRLQGKTIYFYSAIGYGNAKMNNNFFEKKLGLTATTRNWNTCNKLIEMSRENQ